MVPRQLKEISSLQKMRKIQETRVVKSNLDITGISGNIFIDITFH